MWYFAPAIVANMSPVFARNLLKNKFSLPMDCNKKLNGKPILGNHKTYRGLISGVIMAILFAYLQTTWYAKPWANNISIIDYSQIKFWLWGFLMGFGALFGDIAKSFFKRRINVKPGKPWIPFDQIDYLVGSTLFTIGINVPLWDVLLVMFLIMPFITFASVRIGYWLKIRKVKS